MFIFSFCLQSVHTLRSPLLRNDTSSPTEPAVRCRVTSKKTHLSGAGARGKFVSGVDHNGPSRPLESHFVNEAYCNTCDIRYLRGLEQFTSLSKLTFNYFLLELLLFPLYISYGQ